MAKFTTDSKYLSHSDISDVEDTIVTIKSYDRETMGQGAQATEKWVLYFREIKKGLGLNKTNGKILISLFNNDDMDEWIGKKIALYVKDDVEYQGEIMSAIRVRTKLPGKAAVQASTSKPAAQPTAEEDSGPLTLNEIIYRMDHAESVAEVSGLMNQAMELDMSDEDMKSLKAIRDQRFAALRAAK